MKYPDDYINKVIQGDCLEIMRGMPDKSVDLVLTDPPYGINVGGKSRERERERVIVGIAAIPFGNKGRNKRIVAPKSYTGFDDTRIPSAEIFEEMRRVSKNQIIFGGNYFTVHLPSSSCWSVWDKDNAESFFADCELAWTSFNTAVRKVKWRWFGMLQGDMKNKEERVHPTQKPVPVMSWILENYSEKNQTILDPFLGSGTTAVAAKALNRNFIGIEISEKYCAIARERLQSVTQAML